MSAYRPDKTILDRETLKALSEFQPAATYVLRNRLDWRGSPFHRTPIKTSHVLTACRRLESAGLIEEIQSSYAVMKTWTITPAGRTALQEGGRAE